LIIPDLISVSSQELEYLSIAFEARLLRAEEAALSVDKRITILTVHLTIAYLGT